ncbi:MAG: glycosyltransferase [Microbacterium sp.]
MDTAPLVSIVIPAFNDRLEIATALESCLRQTLPRLEIIVVDDASTDATADLVAEFAARDSRIRLIRQKRNRSALQARRVGVLAARAEHVLFLDGDDELVEQAAELALSTATATGADLVRFGVTVVRRDGTTGGRFEDRLQPSPGRLEGPDVLRGLFPVGRPAQGQLWRALFRTRLLRDAYALVPEDLVLPRVNDLPIAFLAAALATSCEAVPDRLYRYHFGSGGSGQRIDDMERVVFYASAIHSIGAIASAVSTVAARSATPDVVSAAYASAREFILGYTTSYIAQHTRSDLLTAAFAHLCTRAPLRDIVRATAEHFPKALDVLAEHTGGVNLGERPVASVLLATNTVRTGGVSGVVQSQARLLQRAGFRVTIAALESGSDTSALPDGVDLVEVPDGNLATRLAGWSQMCRQYEIDVVIDHHWLYSRNWPVFALAARAEGVATIGWAHNFAGRPILLGLNRLDFQTRHLGSLATLVVLSPLDVAFWKLRGARSVVYLPNPPSPLLLGAAAGSSRRAIAGRRLELIWWGRLDQRTKRVTELVEVAAHLRDMGIDFRLRIVGPDWNDMTAEKLTALACERGVADRVDAVGPLHGQDLVDAVESSDVFVNTSIIEGYPLTIPEAQSQGLPVFMYELPWLSLADGNDGIVAVRQGDAAGLARRIAEVARDDDRYIALSAGAVAAADRELTRDYSTLYQRLLENQLPAEHSPEPTIHDAQQLIDLMIEFAEDRAEEAWRAPSSFAQTDERATASHARSARTEGATPRSELVRWITPVAQTLVRVVPPLRPLAFRVKHVLLRR